MSFNPDKTEIMLFSNTDVRYNFNFTFNGNNIPITMSHTNLGVTLSSDAKWNNHIENIILSESRHLGILRKLKYRLSRQNLEKLYLVYISAQLLNMPVKYGIIVECAIQPSLKNCN
jgi:hypothetical protein